MTRNVPDLPEALVRNVPDLPEALVRKHLQEALDTCRETNKQPSVLMLARRLDLTNTTFRRRYPDIAREIADHRATPTAPRSGPTAHDRLVARNAKTPPTQPRADRSTHPRCCTDPAPFPAQRTTPRGTGGDVERHEHHQQGPTPLNK
ncbi:hypothetical protein ACFXAS_21015 [Streptomyces sp. NPDC059459]|uniref:hypothetical protein n=1 Tax=Streptomyces sp. NPDC059459 TaxID=3346839 RepID=UPI0036996D43